MKDAKVQELIQAHNIPAAAAALCVDENGIVNEEKLVIAIQAVQGAQGGQDDATRAKQEEIEILKTALKDIHAQATAPGANKQLLAQRSMRLKDRIFALGGRL